MTLIDHLGRIQSQDLLRKKTYILRRLCSRCSLNVLYAYFLCPLIESQLTRMEISDKFPVIIKKEVKRIRKEKEKAPSDIFELG